MADTEAVDVVVREGDCPCPGGIHREEHVYLEPEASLAIAHAAFAAMQMAEATFAAQYSAAVSAFIPLAIRGWSFIEKTEDGKTGPVPVNRVNAERLIPWDKGGFEVADRADDLYSDRVMSPLVRRLSSSSPPTSTEDSTSPTLEPSFKPPTPLRRSSPTSSAGTPSEDLALSSGARRS